MNIIDIITANQLVFIIIAGILGLIIGSFLNVVIYRLPIILKNEYEMDYFEYFHKTPTPIRRLIFNLATPGSHCPKCKAPISWWQNIPVVSYIILRGRCANCSTNIAWRYPVIELLCCMATILVARHFGIDVKTPPMLILTWALIAAIFIDLEQQMLPDQITLPLMWLGLLLNTSYIFTSPQNAIIGAISGYIFLWTITKVFKLIRKVDAMGYGDFKLFAVFGAWLGWQILPIIILAASLIGAIMGISLVFSRKHQFAEPLPFGPYLATTGWLAFFWGQPILNWFIYHH